MTCLHDHPHEPYLLAKLLQQEKFQAFARLVIMQVRFNSFTSGIITSKQHQQSEVALINCSMLLQQFGIYFRPGVSNKQRQLMLQYAMKSLFEQETSTPMSC